MYVIVGSKVGQDLSDVYSTGARENGGPENAGPNVTTGPAFYVIML